MREQLGRRPAKYGFGQALGAAISGGGAYFGVLAVEKAKAEALEAARAGKLEDRKAEWDHDAKVAIAASDAEEEQYRSRLKDERETARIGVDNAVSQHDRIGENDLTRLPTKLGLQNTAARKLASDQWNDGVMSGRYEGLAESEARSLKTYKEKIVMDGEASLREYEAKRKSDLEAGVTRTMADQDSRDDLVEARANAYKATKIAKEQPVLGSDLTSQYGMKDESIVPGTHYIALTNDTGEVINYIKDPEWSTGPNGVASKIGSEGGTGEKPSGIRKEFTSATNTFVMVDEAYGRIAASAENPSAAGDLSMIFNYMKMLDPGSVVRESEFATARGAASVPERFKATYSKVLSGEMLSPATRQDFVSRADSLYSQALAGYDTVSSEFTRMATESNISPSLVVFNRANMRDYKSASANRRAPAPNVDTTIADTDALLERLRNL